MSHLAAKAKMSSSRSLARLAASALPVAVAISRVRAARSAARRSRAAHRRRTGAGRCAVRSRGATGRGRRCVQATAGSSWRRRHWGVGGMALGRDLLGIWFYACVGETASYLAIMHAVLLRAAPASGPRGTAHGGGLGDPFQRVPWAVDSIRKQDTHHFGDLPFPPPIDGLPGHPEVLPDHRVTRNTFVGANFVQDHVDDVGAVRRHGGLFLQVSRATIRHLWRSSKGRLPCRQNRSM